MRTNTIALLLSGPLLLGGVCGCADYHRERADAAVYKILRDRKYDALAYSPQTVVGPEGAPEQREVAPKAPWRAYERIPVTPIPPPEEPPLTIPQPETPGGPLGPFPEDLPPVPPPSTPSTRDRSDGAGAGANGPNGANGGAVRAAALVRGAAGAGAPAVGAPATGTVQPGGAPPLNGGLPSPGALEANRQAGELATRPAPASSVDPQRAKLYDTPEARSIREGGPLERLRYGPPAPLDRPLALDLFGALEYAIRHAPTYRDRMDEVYLAALDVTLERHLFEPRFFARTGLQFTGNQRPGDYRSALTATANVGVRQRLPYGGEIVAEALVDFVNTINGNVTEGESAELALSGSIPLLRGAGLTNLEALISSERQVVYTIRSFEDFRRQFAVQVADQYFEVLTRQQAVNNRRQNVRNLTLLLDRAKALRGAPIGVQGRLNDLEVQRSEQALLEGENRLLIAQQAYLNSVDDFKLLIGMPIERELAVTPVALQVNVPDIETRDVVDLAHRFRLDLQTARDRIDDARRLVEVAKNGLLPDLDLTGRVSAGNREGDPAREVNRRTMEYSAGITLDLPVDRVAERNQYRRALIAYHRAERTYEDLQDTVSADVRSAVRAIRQAQFTVEIQRRAILVAERRLEYAFILLQIGGRINARDVVEAQQSLLTAQDALDVAQAELQVEVLNFLRRTGTLRVDPEAGLIGRAMDRARSEPDPVDVPAFRARGVPVEPADAAPPAPRRQAPPVPQARGQAPGQAIPANRVQ